MVRKNRTWWNDREWDEWDAWGELLANRKLTPSIVKNKVRLHQELIHGLIDLVGALGEQIRARNTKQRRLRRVLPII